MRLYGCNMKSTSPVHLYLTGLETGGVVYRECERQSFDFTKILVSESRIPALVLQLKRKRWKLSHENAGLSP